MPSGSPMMGVWVFVALAVGIAALAGVPARAEDAAPLRLRPMQDSPLEKIDPPLDASQDLEIAPKSNQKASKPKTKPISAGLPALQPYKGAQRLGQKGGPPALRESLTPAPGVATIPPAPERRRIKPDDKPFDPVGVRIGDLKLTPYVEESVGYSSNPGLVSGSMKGSLFETTEAGLGLQSDWSRNDLRGDFKGGYTDYFAAPNYNAPFGSGTLDGRYDVSRDLAFDAEGRFNVMEEPVTALGVTPASGAFNANTTVATYGATLGASQKFGDLTLGLHGAYDRTAYSDVALVGGVASQLSSDDHNDWGIKARATYRLTAAFSPFLEFGFDTRRYDSTTDAFGYARNSDGGAARLGAKLDYSQKLTGELSVGYGERAYQDARLPRAAAPLIDASLIWSATPLTTVTVKAQSALADSVLPGASADVTRNYTIDVSHALTRAVTLGVAGGYATDHYIGVALDDHSTTIGLKGEYHLSREVVLKASATRQQLVSNGPGLSYVANVFMLGLRLQR